MNLTAGGRTDCGPRALNQDWLDWNLSLGFFVVADGMGGHNAGEVASQLAVETIRDFLAESVARGDQTWPFPFDPKQTEEANRLLCAVRLANRRIYAEGTKHAALEGMGTTVVVLLLSEGLATLVSVGDSRIYLWRRGALRQLTHDDTWLAAVLGHEDADRTDSSHPLKHVLTAVVGTKEDIHPLAIEVPLETGDRFVLCTDGVHGRLDQTALSDVMAGGGSAEELATRLVSESIARRTTDNATALVVAVDDGVTASASGAAGAA